MPPAASAPRASRIPAAQQSAHVLQQQKQYAAHLSAQLHTLSRHTGVYGQLDHAVQSNQEQAAQVGQAIEQAQLNLSKRSKAAAEAAAAATAAAAAASSAESASSDKENDSCSSPPPALPPAPDLDALASSLESLARSLASQEVQAESQSVGLRTEIARVMEVYEDPAGFLPPPLQGAPDFGGYLSSSSGAAHTGSKGRSSSRTAQLPPSELLAQAYGPQALHSGLPGVDPPQPIYNHTSKSTGFDYGVMTSFLRGMVRARVSEEIDGDDAAHRGAPSMHAGFDPSLHDPSDPLTTLRRDLARKFATLERDPVLLASKENVRKSVAEAAAKPGGPSNVLSARLAGEPKKSRRGSLEEAPAAPPAGKPRARRTDLNPEVFPAFAELSAIFGSNPHAAAAPHAAAQKMFGGLSAAIPSYLAYQEYLASQQAQQEAAAAAAEAQRVAEEQREILAAAKREARESRERRQREEEAARARAAALAQAQAAAIAATAAAAAALVVPPLPIHQVSSSAAAAAAAAHPPSHREGRSDASTDTRPPLQSAYSEAFHAPSHPMSAAYFGGGASVSRFDALWEVAPQARDAAVQSEASSLQHASQQQQQHQKHDAGTLMTPRPASARGIAPSSLPSSPRQIAPRATAQFGAHFPQQQLEQLQHQESLARRGTGPQAAGSAPSGSAGAGGAPRASALTVLEQAALEVQAQGKRMRGEGLSSSKALDSLMATAAQQQQPPDGSVIRVVTRDQTPSELSVPPHPLFSATPSAALASYPSTGLLNLVLQMYDMPSERQVDAEWKRVLSLEEEAAEARAREERGETQTEEHKQKSEEERLQLPVQQEGEEDYEADVRREAEADARVAQAAADQRAAAARAQHPKADDAAASAESKQAEELRARLAEESAERARLVAESARLAHELDEVKRQQQQQLAQQQQEQMIQQAVQAAVQSPQPIAAVAADPSAAAEREAEQRRVWELEARARWTAELEAKKAAADAAAADAARHAEQLSQIEAATRALQAEAESIRAAAAERKALEAAAIAPALAAEIDKIRAAQLAERAMMDSVREEERKRYEAEEQRRAEERQKQLAAQAAEEAQYAQRRAEREAEEERRRELERKREELMENRMAMEAERTSAELAKLRAEVERMRAQPVETASAAATTVPLRHRAIRVAHSFGGDADDSQDLSSSGYGFELTDPASRFNPKADLSEGEIDLAGFHAARGGNVSPGQVGPSGSTLRPPQRVQMPARRTAERHTAAVLHPPIPSVTPARPGAGAGRKTVSVAEQKYPVASSSMYSSSSTRDDILDLLNASKLADINAPAGAAEDVDPVQSQAALPLASQFNVAYTSSIAAARRALQVPSRQVLVGPSSPALTDISDVSSRPSTASSVSTPSPVPRHRSSRSPVTSSKKALRLLKKKYAVLQARQLALEDETSSFGSMDDSAEPVEDQIARAKRRSKFAGAAATTRAKSGTRREQDDDEQFMPSAAVHAHVRRAATRVEAAVEAASRPTPSATADSVTSGRGGTIHPPLDRAADHPQSALSPLKHRAVRSTTPNLQSHHQQHHQPQQQQPQSRVPTPLEAQQGRDFDAPIVTQPVMAPATPAHPSAPVVASSAAAAAPASGEDDSYADEFDIPHEADYHAAPPRTADAAPSFLTALSPPSSSPPSPAAAAFSPTAVTSSSSSAAAPAGRPSTAAAARPSSTLSTSGSRPVTGSGRFVEPASPSSRAGSSGGKASLLTSQPLRMSQAQMVAQHRAKLQAAKMASLQSSAAAATAAAEAAERPSSSASVGSASDPFAAHGGSGASRPTSSSSSLIGGGIGGLHGFDSARAHDRDRQQQRVDVGSTSPGLISAEEDVVDEQLEVAADDHSFSFNSPESKTATATEQWIRSLRDE